MRQQTWYTILVWGATVLLTLGHSTTSCWAQLAMSTAGNATSGVLEVPELDPTLGGLDFEPSADSASSNGYTTPYDFKALGVKFTAFLGILLCTCLAVVSLNRRRPLSRRSVKKGGLRVDDSITLAAGVGLKLIEVGPQRMVVGYDRHGIKNMMLIDNGFDEILDQAEHASIGPSPSMESPSMESPSTESAVEELPAAVEAAEEPAAEEPVAEEPVAVEFAEEPAEEPVVERRGMPVSAFLKPKDHGWDLSRPTI